MKIKYILSLSLAIILSSCGGGSSLNSPLNSNSGSNSEEIINDVVVTFFADPSDTGTIYNTQNVKTGDLLTKPANPEPIDPAFNVFKGWSKIAFASSESDYWNFSQSTIPEGIKKMFLYGQWESSDPSTPGPSTSDIPPVGDQKTIYLNPGIWETDSPKYYAWIWGGEDEGSWVDFVSDSSLYKITIDNTHTGIIFFRAPQDAEHGWNEGTTVNYWNKTGDETINYTNNVFEITGWGTGTGSTGTWTIKS